MIEIERQRERKKETETKREREREREKERERERKRERERERETHQILQTFDIRRCQIRTVRILNHFDDFTPRFGLQPPLKLKTLKSAECVSWGEYEAYSKG